jgi:hypothetical protein
MSHYEDPRAASIECAEDRAAGARLGARWRHCRHRNAVIGIPASDVEGVATFYNMIFRQSGRAARDQGLRQHRLLSDRLRRAQGALMAHPPGSTTARPRRWPLHAAAGLLSRQLRQGPTLMIDDDTAWPGGARADVPHCWSATRERCMARSAETHPLTWRLDHGEPVVDIKAYEALAGYAALRKALPA